jgi:hypothetical protein
VNPGFGGNELDGEAEPEGGAEEFVRREAGEAAGGEEEADDWPDGGNGQAGGERADHPLAMKGDLAVANVPEGFSQGKEKKRGEECRGGRLVDTSDCRHAEAHDQRGDSNDSSASEEDAAVDAVERWMVRPNGCAELKWAENHKEKTRNDVNESEKRIVSEEVVERGELRGDGIWRWLWRPIAVKNHRKKYDSSAEGDGNADNSQKNHAGPQEAAKTASRLHACIYVGRTGLLSPVSQQAWCNSGRAGGLQLEWTVRCFFRHGRNPQSAICVEKLWGFPLLGN